MKSTNKMQLPEYIRKTFDKYKYALLVCIAGILLAIVPSCGSEKAETQKQNAIETEGVLPDTKSLERSMEEAFSAIEGVGKVKVILTVKSGYESVYAYDKQQAASRGGDNAESQSQESMVLRSAGGEQSPVSVRVDYPIYSGALVVCEGGGSARIQLLLTEAVRSLTGITSDNIIVSKMTN